MKKLLLLSIILFSSVINAQNYLGKDANLYKGTTLRTSEIPDNLQEYNYNEFYNEFDKEQLKFPKRTKKNVPFSSGPNYMLKSDYNKMVNQEFKVTNVYDVNSKHKSDLGRYYALELKNDAMGVVYYKYDSKYNHEFKFEIIDGLELPDDFYCKNIVLKQDKFTKSKSFFSPLYSGILFMKYIDKDGVDTYLSVFQHGNSLSVYASGLYLLFENGEVMEFPDTDLNVEADGSNYKYKAFVNLSDKQLEYLSNNLITDKKIYIYDNTISKESAIAIQGYAKCMKGLQ